MDCPHDLVGHLFGRRPTNLQDYKYYCSTLNYKFFRLSFLFDEFPLIGRNAMTYGSSRADPHRYGVQTSNL